jgi:hypothetical protein
MFVSLATGFWRLQQLPLSCGQRVTFCPVTKSHQKTPFKSEHPWSVTVEQDRKLALFIQACMATHRSDVTVDPALPLEKENDVLARCVQSCLRASVLGRIPLRT